MSYVGNPSLNEETKARIRTTFGQTMQLASAGRLQEAVLGCDFILKMDPQFSPARNLLARLDGAEGAVDVSDLELSSANTEGTASRSHATSGTAEPALQQGTSQQGTSPGAGLPPLPESEGSGQAGVQGGGELDLLGAPGLNDPSPLGAAPISLDAPSLDGASPSSEDDDRVQALLQEGQASFDNGAYQSAIDAWSRIFLIDIDHEEASNRIEEARRRKDESERSLEEMFHGAVDRIDSGEVVEGRAQLESVLALQPDHVGAQERIKALDAADAADAAEAAGGEEGQELGDSGALAGAPGGVGAGAAPAPGSMPSVPKPSPFAAPKPVVASGPAKGGGRTVDRKFLYIGAGALLVVFGVGGFLYANWSALFPNAPSGDAAPVSFKRTDPVAAANRLYVSGDIAGALEILDKVPEGAARYERAQEQAEEWRIEEQAKETARVQELAGAEDRLMRRETLLETARRFYAEGEFFRAAKDFNGASRIGSLDGPAAEMFEDAKRQLLPIQQQITLFREGEWERMQAPLWRILETDPGNLDARGLLVDSYYNLGVQALRRGNARDALEPLQESDRLRPSDPMVERVLLLARTYAQRDSSDALFSIFVEELKYRR